MKKGNLVKIEEWICKDISSTPEIIERTGMVINCHNGYCSVVCLDNGSLIAVKLSVLRFVDNGGDFFLKQIEKYFLTKEKD